MWFYIHTKAIPKDKSAFRAIFHGKTEQFEAAHGVLITETHDLISRLLHDLKIKHAR